MGGFEFVAIHTHIHTYVEFAVMEPCTTIPSESISLILILC